MDAYAVLGVEPTASDAEIRDAYLRRSKQLHPDQHAEATADQRAEATRAMQELNAAYDALRERDRDRDREVVATPPPAWQAPPVVPATPPRRRRWIAVALAATLVASLFVVATRGARDSPPAPDTADSTADLTALKGYCITLDSLRQIEDIVDCTRPHDARVVEVVAHGAACPIWAHERMAFPKQDLCLDTHQ